MAGLLGVAACCKHLSENHSNRNYSPLCGVVTRV
jgi:hypothetical protein